MEQKSRKSPVYHLAVFLHKREMHLLMNSVPAADSFSVAGSWLSKAILVEIRTGKFPQGGQT